MVMKSLLAEIVDGRLVLPHEALAMLPEGSALRVIVDSERGTVCIFAKDPMTLSPRTEELMDALGDLSEGLTWEEYSKPVPEEALRRGPPAHAGTLQEAAGLGGAVLRIPEEQSPRADGRQLERYRDVL